MALNPDAVVALTRFLAAEGDTIKTVGDAFSSVVGDDTQHLYSAIAAVFGVKPPDGGVMSAKTVIKPSATATSPVSGAVDNTTAKGQQGLDPGSRGVVTGTHSQDGSVRPAKVNAPGQKGDTAPAKQSGTEIKDQSPSNSTDATDNEATKDDPSKGDTTTPRSQSTSTSKSNEHNGVSSSPNNATKEKGATKVNSSTHTRSRTPSHAASSGAKHSGASGAAGRHSGKGSHGSK